MRYQFVLEYNKDCDAGKINTIVDIVNSSMKDFGYSERDTGLHKMKPPQIVMDVNQELSEEIIEGCINEVNETLVESDLPFTCIGVERVEDE